MSVLAAFSCGRRKECKDIGGGPGEGHCSGGEKARGLMGWVDPDWNGVGIRMKKSLGSVCPERQEGAPRSDLERAGGLPFLLSSCCCPERVSHV